MEREIEDVAHTTLEIAVAGSLDRLPVPLPCDQAFFSH